MQRLLRSGWLGLAGAAGVLLLLIRLREAGYDFVAVWDFIHDLG